MAKADRSHSTPPTSTSSPITQVTHGLFELEGPLLRVRDLTQAISMGACSPELSKEETGALQALAFTILDEINEVIAERTRLCHLSSASEGDSHG